MAPNEKHSPHYNSIAARSLRVIEGAQQFTGDTWRSMVPYKGHESNKQHLSGIFTAMALALGTAATTALIYDNQAGNSGNVFYQTVPDHDLSGGAYMAQRYSVIDHEGQHYLLLRDEGRYEMYQWNFSNLEYHLIDFDATAPIITDVTEDIRRRIDIADLDPDGNYSGDFRTCQFIYEPNYNDDGFIEREITDCARVSDLTDVEVLDVYEENWQFWMDAQAAMSEDRYGPSADKIAAYTPPPPQAEQESYFDTFKNAATYSFGGWLAIGLAGGGIAGLRRRVNKKPNGPL